MSQTTKQEVIGKVFAEALARPDGVEIMLDSKHEAQKMRFYLYNLRSKMRKKGVSNIEAIDSLDFILKPYPMESKCAVLVKVGGKLWDSLRVVDVASGENLTKKLEVIDEMVSISEEELGLK